MDSYFDFIIFLAFERYYDSEDKRSLTYEELHNYRIALTKKHMEYHSRFSDYNDEYLPDLLKEFHNFELNMSLEEESKYFANFLINYKEYFDFDQERIYLKENVDMESFKDVKFKLPFYENPYNKLICGELIGFSKDSNPMDALHAYKIKNESLKLIELEKTLEKYYYEYKNIKSSPNINIITKNIIDTLTKIGNLPYAKIRCYNSLISSLKELYDKEDYNNISENMAKDKFCEFHEQYLYYLFASSFYDAIFGSKSIACDKLLADITGLFKYKALEEAQNSEEDEEEIDSSDIMELIFPDKFLEEKEKTEEEIAAYHDEFEDKEIDENEYKDDDEDEEISEKELAKEEVEIYLFTQDVNRAFYLRYILLVHYIINKYGENEDLEKVKSRLLFLLDNYGESLTEENNFLKALKSVPLNKFTKDDLEDFYMIARVFLIEILKEYVEVDILKKLIYISTYYILTKDIVIDRILTKYQNTEIGQKVKNAIYNNDYSDFITKDKKLIRDK